MGGSLGVSICGCEAHWAEGKMWRSVQNIEKSSQIDFSKTISGVKCRKSRLFIACRTTFFTKYCLKTLVKNSCFYFIRFIRLSGLSGFRVIFLKRFLSQSGRNRRFYRVFRTKTSFGTCCNTYFLPIVVFKAVYFENEFIFKLGSKMKLYFMLKWQVSK